MPEMPPGVVAVSGSCFVLPCRVLAKRSRSVDEMWGFFRQKYVQCTYFVITPTIERNTTFGELGRDKPVSREGASLQRVKPGFSTSG